MDEGNNPMPETAPTMNYEDDPVRRKLAEAVELLDEIKALGEDITAPYAARIEAIESVMAELVSQAKSQGHEL